MIYCGKCNISYNDFVHEHECSIQKGKQLIFRPEQVRLTNQQQTTHEEGDVILHPHYFTDSYENNYEIQFSNFLTDARNLTTPFIFNSNGPLSGRPIRILTRQHGIIEERRHSPNVRTMRKIQLVILILTNIFYDVIAFYSQINKFKYRLIVTFCVLL